MHSKPAITIDTAAALMGVSKRTLWRYLRDGKLSQPGSGQRAAGSGQNDDSGRGGG